MGAAADAVRAGSKVNANDLNHIFGKPGHNLDGYLRSFGGDEEKAYLALEKAVDEYVRANDITSYTDGITVNVNGYDIVVTGVVADGFARIGTAYIRN